MELNQTYECVEQSKWLLDSDNNSKDSSGKMNYSLISFCFIFALINFI